MSYYDAYQQSYSYPSTSQHTPYSQDAVLQQNPAFSQRTVFTEDGLFSQDDGLSQSVYPMLPPLQDPTMRTALASYNPLQFPGYTAQTHQMGMGIPQQSYYGQQRNDPYNEFAFAVSTFMPQLMMRAHCTFRIDVGESLPGRLFRLEHAAE